MASWFMLVISRISSKNVVLSVRRPTRSCTSLHRALTTQSLPLYSNKVSGTGGTVFHEVPSLTKDVLLYINKNQRYFRWMTLFGVTQFLFWNSIAFFFQAKAKDIDPKEEMKQAKSDAHPFIYKIRDFLNFENKYKHGICIMFSVLGSGAMLVTGFLALRNIHMVVLRKGGQTVDIVTFALLGTKRTIANLPLSHVSCQHSMHVKRPYMNLKIKGRSMYFVLDNEGLFPNPKLFEQTVGLYRTLGKKK